MSCTSSFCCWICCSATAGFSSMTLRACLMALSTFFSNARRWPSELTELAGPRRLPAAGSAVALHVQIARLAGNHRRRAGTGAAGPAGTYSGRCRRGQRHIHSAAGFLCHGILHGLRPNVVRIAARASSASFPALIELAATEGDSARRFRPCPPASISFLALVKLSASTSGSVLPPSTLA